MKTIMTGLIAAGLTLGFTPVASAANPTIVKKQKGDFCLAIVFLCVPQEKKAEPAKKAPAKKKM